MPRVPAQPGKGGHLPAAAGPARWFCPPTCPVPPRFPRRWDLAHPGTPSWKKKRVKRKWMNVWYFVVVNSAAAAVEG